MPIPPWSDVRNSLAAAIRAALPLQVEQVRGQRIAGIGLHIDACYGSAGLYLLPEAVAAGLDPRAAANIGDWPISTDWDGSTDHAEAFNEHWQEWDDWFHDQSGAHDDDELEAVSRGLHLVACGAMRQVETEGGFDAFAQTDDFRVIIAEHDEPDALAVERYELFVRTGIIRCFGSDEG